MSIITTQEYFNRSIDELLEIRNEYGYTREECLLFDDGIRITFFDDEKEMQEEQEEFNQYIKSGNLEIKATVKTVNERLAVILV